MNSTSSVTALECLYCFSVDLVMASGTVCSFPPMVSSSGPPSSFSVSTFVGECGENAALALEQRPGRRGERSPAPESRL